MSEENLKESLNKLLLKLNLSEHFDSFWEYVKNGNINANLRYLINFNENSKKAMDLIREAELMTLKKITQENLLQEEVTPQVIKVRFFPYLKTMVNLVWSAVRYPTKTTEIDLNTGNIIKRY